MRHTIWLPEGDMETLRDLASDLDILAKAGLGQGSLPSVSALLASLAASYRQDPSVLKQASLPTLIKTEKPTPSKKPGRKLSPKEQAQAYLADIAPLILGTCANCEDNLLMSFVANVDYIHNEVTDTYLCIRCAKRLGFSVPSPR